MRNTLFHQTVSKMKFFSGECDLLTFKRLKVKQRQPIETVVKKRNN